MGHVAVVEEQEFFDQVVLQEAVGVFVASKAIHATLSSGQPQPAAAEFRLIADDRFDHFPRQASRVQHLIVGAVNLACDPAPLMALSVDQIRERLFTRAADLPEGVERLPLKMIHMNKCPVLVTPKLVDPATATRLNLDVEGCHANWKKLQGYDIVSKLQQVYSESGFAARTDPERMLYDGFLSNSDKAEDLKSTIISHFIR